MEIYLVGGAVRDELLGLSFHERDWVVVDAAPDQLLNQGFRQVGKDFPVFLHPDTGEEYALARTERKVGLGYHGFSFSTGHVSLEDDLKRRDLTINAMAKNNDGQIIDPYGGRRDLAEKKLRHVSEAFIEDPLRILRLARFYARFYHLGFTVAPETMQLLKNMVAKGELATLNADRVWQEWQRSLQERAPEQFIELLRECGALVQLIPELDVLFGIPNPPKWHPEIDTGRHILLALKKAAVLTHEPSIRFAVLMHDIGKGLTPSDAWPHHHGHGELGIEALKSLSKRYRFPKHYLHLTRLVMRYHSEIHKAAGNDAKRALMVLKGLDVSRRPDVLEQVLLACRADFCGRQGREHAPYPQCDYWLNLAETYNNVTADSLKHLELHGQALGQAIADHQVLKLGDYMEREPFLSNL